MERSKEEVQLASGKISNLFLKFGVPGVLGLLFVGFQPMVDGIFLINHVGSDALAGVNLFVPIYTFVSALAVVVGIGCQTIVSMSLGRRSYADADDAFRTAVFFLTVFLSVFSVCVYFGAESLSQLLGADVALSSYTQEYMKAFSPFLPVLSLVFLGDYMLKASGRPFLALSLLGLILFLNILFNYIFIVLLEKGVKGAAFATGISLTTSFVAMIFALTVRSRILDFRRGKFRGSLLWKMVYNGSSEGLSEMSAGITVFLFNLVMMELFGKSGVAAFTSVNYLLYLGVQLYVGLSDGIIPILSYNYGAGNGSRVKSTLRLASCANFVIGLCFFFILFFCSDYLVGRFFSSSVAEDFLVVSRIATTGASVVAFAFFVNGQNILSSSFFTSLGDAKSSVVISLMRGLLFVVVGLYLLPMMLGEYGVWLVIPVAEAFTFVYCLIIVRKRLTWLSKMTS